jgi:hypothetical protein
MLCIPAAHIMIFGFGIIGASVHFVFAFFCLHLLFSAHRYRLLFDLTRHSSYATPAVSIQFTPGRFWDTDPEFWYGRYQNGGHEAPDLRNASGDRRPRLAEQPSRSHGKQNLQSLRDCVGTGGEHRAHYNWGASLRSCVRTGGEHRTHFSTFERQTPPCGAGSAEHRVSPYARRQLWALGSDAPEPASPGAVLLLV